MKASGSKAESNGVPVRFSRRPGHAGRIPKAALNRWATEMAQGAVRRVREARHVDAIRVPARFVVRQRRRRPSTRPCRRLSGILHGGQDAANRLRAIPRVGAAPRRSLPAVCGRSMCEVLGGTGGIKMQASCSTSPRSRTSCRTPTTRTSGPRPSSASRWPRSRGELEEDFEGARRIDLDTTYRSTKNILDDYAVGPFGPLFIWKPDRFGCLHLNRRAASCRSITCLTSFQLGCRPSLLTKPSATPRTVVLAVPSGSMISSAYCTAATNCFRCARNSPARD